jgi:hypothetical protein
VPKSRQLSTNSCGSVSEPSASQGSSERMAVQMPDHPTMTSTLDVTNNYQWIGNPSAAGFIVYLDGLRIGIASPGRSLEAQAQPGPHRGVRLWYFLSPARTTAMQGYPPVTTSTLIRSGSSK